MGVAPDAPVAVQGTLPDSQPEGFSLAEWVQMGEQNRADLRALQDRVRAQEYEVNRERGTILPQVAAFGSVAENSHELRHGGESFAVGLKATVGVFDPGYRARVREQRARLEQWTQDAAALKDEVGRSLAEAYERQRAAQLNRPVLDEATADAGQAVELMVPLYQEGRKSIVDLMEMRQAHLGVATRRQQLKLEAVVGETNLWFLAGVLDEERLEDLSRRIAETP
jgi:outer membrane protein TolC